MGFAFLDAVNDGADPVDSLSSYIDEINEELTRKRKEFGLPTTDDELWEGFINQKELSWQEYIASKNK